MRAVWLLVLVVALGGGYWAWGAFESEPPTIQTLTNMTYVGKEHLQEFTVMDGGRGVETLRVWVQLEDDEVELLSTRYDGTWHSGSDLNIPRRVQVTLDPKTNQLPEGRSTLLAEATDFSFRRNTTRVEIPLLVDTRAPRVTVLTGLTYVRQGGAELAVYELDENSPKHGVQVGDAFFRGFVHPENPKQFVALYALPHDQRGASVSVIADDLAGNRTSIPLSISVIESRPTSDRIQLTEAFMRAKISEITGGEPESVLEGYLALNRDVREDNARTIRKVCSESSEERLWSEPFLQMPNSKVGAGFAEARTYVFDGKEVDAQTHLGFDLASTARAEIPAANDGVVVFAGDLGIYGRTVILDHGLSLFSLYGHLSELAVEKGQLVTRGKSLGRSGTTGLAGGDHLHFAMLLGGTFIDPLEWFDERWIQEHLEVKLRKATPESSTPLDVPAAPDDTGA